MSKKVKEYTVCCDSADLYAWLIKDRPELPNGRDSSNYNRWVFCALEEGVVKINFVHKYSNREGYSELAGDLLKETAGTPDYILFDSLGAPLACIEDSKTAPVGNAVIQRMDKLFPLLANNKIKFPVVYIGPKSGKDESQNTERGWSQSWFYKCFAGQRKDMFKLLPPGESVCEKTFEYILEVIIGDLKGKPVTKKGLTKGELKTLHEGMEKNIRTYKSGVFSGKLFKPDGTDAHPVQSTLMIISDVRKSLGKNPVKIKADDLTLKKLKKSKSKRVVRVMNRNPILELKQ